MPLAETGLPPVAAKAGGPVVVFDALCVLCSANARLILRHDKRRRLRLAGMQGDAGSAIYRALGIDASDPATIVVVDGEQVWQNSDAVLKIHRELGWPWKALSALAIVPRIVRDPVYRLIARSRYRIFGKRQTCWVPAPGDADRILP